MIRRGYSFGTYRPVPGDDHLIDAVFRVAQAAEASGFDSLWVPDHLMQTPVVGPPEDPMLECYTTLAALAAVTSRVRLGAFVGAAAYRNPALLGKMVTTLDVISRGRAVFGIGAGWFEEEHTAYGYELGSVGERLDRLVDVLDIVQPMLRSGASTHAGTHFHTHGALNVPPPVQPGGPPTLIGGSGEKRTLRLVAERADICNVAGTPEHVRHLMGVLDRHCEDVGRDPSAICRTYITPVVLRSSVEEAAALLPEQYRNRAQPAMGTAADVQARLTAIREAGIDGLIVSVINQDRNPERIAEVAEVVRSVFD